MRTAAAFALIAAASCGGEPPFTSADRPPSRALWDQAAVAVHLSPAGSGSAAVGFHLSPGRDLRPPERVHVCATMVQAQTGMPASACAWATGCEAGCSGTVAIEGSAPGRYHMVLDVTDEVDTRVYYYDRGELLVIVD